MQDQVTNPITLTPEDVAKGVVCIFHHPCADGFTSAWVFRNYLEERQRNWGIEIDCEYIPAAYGEDVPNVDGKTVVILDFSYPAETLKQMAADAHRVIILDHHKTAKADLIDLLVDDEPANLTGIFDMYRSGAGITWDTFFPERPRPLLVMHVEDRDLWKFENPHTAAIQQYVFSLDYTFGNWDLMHSWLQSPDEYARIVSTGNTLIRKHNKDVGEITPKAAHLVTLSDGEDSVTGMAVNVPYFYASETGHRIAKEHPFGMTYWIDSDGMANVSLRSDADNKDHVDVSFIAKSLGGGGHKFAAGFQMPADKFLLMITDGLETEHTQWVRGQFSDAIEQNTNTASQLFITNNLLSTCVSELQRVANALVVQKPEDITHEIRTTLSYIKDAMDNMSDLYDGGQKDVETETVEAEA